MELKQSERNGVVVFELQGKIIGGPDATLINDKIHDLVEKGKSKVVADLSKIEWMNSSGLGILIGALTTMRNAGGNLKLASITDRIKSLLTITKLINVFETYDSIEEAVQSFTS
jgi:anti-sigma B factor antagonist